MKIGLEKFIDYKNVLDELGARDPHELMRCMEIHFIRDCAEMAAKASLYRTESRWGLYKDKAPIDKQYCKVKL